MVVLLFLGAGTVHGNEAVQGKRPAPDVIGQAQAKSLPLIVTKMTMFEACARLAGRVEDGGHARR